MKNSFGNNLSVTLFGESHGKAIGAVIDGIAPGIPVNDEYIKARLDERRPAGKISTARCEGDEYEILSGVYNGYTTGTPITIVIRNSNTKSGDYAALVSTPRPSHADYTAGIKYGGYQDPRGGGHFSGRITAGLVAAGAIVRAALEAKGIYIATHISSIGDVKDRDFDSFAEDCKALSGVALPVLDDVAKGKMLAKIEEAAKDGDSVGGVLETAIWGCPAGIGEPWFDTAEGVLAHAIFSIPGIKGVEFGLGFGFGNAKGSEANDPFVIDGNEVKTATNNNGGVNGGITNGMPIIFRSAVKPTPSIFKTQRTVNLDTMTECELEISGRHDPAIIHRARAVVDAVAAIAMADLLTTRYGTEWLAK